MMLFFFAGRSILIVLLTFFSFVGSSPSRPHSRLVHVLQREVTITDQVTKTVLTTDSVTLSSFRTSLPHHRSTFVSSSSPFSSAFLSSITETSFLSSSSITSRAYVLIIVIC